MVIRTLVAVGAVAVVGLHANQVFAADSASCSAASESGQRLRQSEKLKAAREQFLICADEACPRLIKADCIQWVGEVSSAIPTVTIGVLDEGGHDLIDVKVLVDGVAMMQRLDGKGLSLDPGVHSIRVEPAGKEPKEERVVISVGEKARKVSFTYAATSTQPPQTRPVREREHSVVPWIVVGVGVASVGVGMGLALSVSASDKAVPASCVNGSCPDADKEKGNNAVAAKNQQTAGYIAIGAGSALIVGGIIWHFLEPSGPEPKSSGKIQLRIRPEFSFNYAGVGGSF